MITDFSGLTRAQLTAALDEARGQFAGLRERMILRKAAGKSFYDLKVAYVQLRRLIGILEFWRGWSHDLPAYHAAHAADLPALRAFLASPARPTVQQLIDRLNSR